MRTSITYDKGRVEAYLDGFLNCIKETIAEDTSSGAISKSESQPTQSKRDELLPVYMWCKNLWDKWLIANDENSGTTKSYENPYTVGKFFKNFIFIDCLYRNVFDCLPISCQKFMDLVDGLNAKTTKDDTSLFSFIGNLADRSKCLFIALPDFIDFGTVTEQGEMKDTGLNNMKKIFQPVPMSKMRPMALNNIFVTIYIHEPSKVAVKNNGKLSDYFDICDEYGVISEDAETLFQTVVKESESERKEDNNMTYGAFPVPSFAVGFGGQHNHLFTDVDVNMDNPVSTEHSIRIMSDIAQLGSGNGQSIAYQGQDVYPIFSNYAYECQVTMLGNAQIQPLMYFQLMNIPMWKGSYMIFNVRHSITPGNMVTTFKGMRMSKKCIPFLKKWAYPVPNRIPKPVGDGISMGDGMTGGNYGNIVIGEVTLTTTLITYVKKAIEDGFLNRGNRIIGGFSDRYANAAQVAQKLVGYGGFHPLAAYALVGSFATECGWIFRSTAYTKDTNDPRHQDEGWFGLLNWEHKKRIIAKLKAQGSPNSSKIDINNYRSPNRMTDVLNDEEWVDVTKIFCTDILTGNTMPRALFQQSYNSAEEIDLLHISAYLYKAGYNNKYCWENLNTAVQAYKKKHGYPKKRVVDGVAKAIYHEVALSLYVKNGRVPTLQEMNNYFGVVNDKP